MRPLSKGEQLDLLFRYAWELVGRRLTRSRDRLPDVRSLLTFAYENTEFYREKLTKAGLQPQDIRTWADFAKVPTTTKDELIAAGSAAVVPERAGKAMISRTSGSSGKFLDVYQSASFWIKDSIVGVEAYRQLVQLKASDRLLYANTSEYPFRSIAGLLYKVAYFDNLNSIGRLIDRLGSGRYRVLMIYPSIAADLMWALERKGLQGGETLGLKAIITHSEQSSQQFRKELGAYFNCAVYDEYATEELGRLGLQCQHETLHVIEAESYCEVLDSSLDEAVTPGVAGEIVGTCLFNSTMPIIRYRQGDIATIGTAECPCGTQGRVFHELLGRTNDSFLLPDGEVLPSGRLLDWTYQLILTNRLDIRQFQLVQTELDHCEIRIVVGPHFVADRDDPKVEASFRALLTNSMAISVRHQAFINRTKAGKHVPIVSHVARSMDGTSWPSAIGSRPVYRLQRM